MRKKPWKSYFQAKNFIDEIHQMFPRISAAGFFDIGKPLLISVKL